MKDLTKIPNRIASGNSIVFGASDSEYGVFKVYVKGRGFIVVAGANEKGWEHISVEKTNNEKNPRVPTWEEMCSIKDMFWYPEEECIQFHPKESEYVNYSPYVLHIWRLKGGFEWEK